MGLFQRLIYNEYFFSKIFEKKWLNSHAPVAQKIPDQRWLIAYSVKKGFNRYFQKDAHQKSEGGSVRSDLKKLDSFTLETSKNHLIRNFLRNGRLRVKRNEE